MNTKQLSGELGRKSGLDFEDLLEKEFLGKPPEDKKDIWGEATTRSKTDLIIGSKNYSIKNPKAPSTKTQVQVCSADRFHRLLNPPLTVQEGINKFVGNHPKLLTKEGYKGNTKIMREVCKSWGVDFNTLDSDSECRRSRLLSDNIHNMEEVTNWFFENRTSVFKFALSTSFNDPKNHDTIADTIWWSSKKNDINSIKEFSIAEILKKVEEDAEVSISVNKSVIKIGPMTFQMKGSGKGSAYHNMQFNMSLNDLANFMKKEDS